MHILPSEIVFDNKRNFTFTACFIKEIKVVMKLFKIAN